MNLSSNNLHIHFLHYFLTLSFSCLDFPYLWLYIWLHPFLFIIISITIPLSFFLFSFLPSRSLPPLPLPGLAGLQCLFQSFRWGQIRHIRYLIQFIVIQSCCAPGGHQEEGPWVLVPDGPHIQSYIPRKPCSTVVKCYDLLKLKTVLTCVLQKGPEKVYIEGNDVLLNRRMFHSWILAMMMSFELNECH